MATTSVRAMRFATAALPASGPSQVSLSRRYRAAAAIADGVTPWGPPADYAPGEHPLDVEERTRQAVFDEFGGIAGRIFICLVAVAIGFILAVGHS